MPFEPRDLALIAALGAGMAVASPARAAEPRWDASAELSLARLGSVEETAVAGGVRLSFRVADLVAIDGGAAFSPGDLGDPAFSGSQTELSLGLRLGPAPDPFGFYLAARAGSVHFGEAPEPLACIAIFPPTLTCSLSGHTGASLQLGAGLERTLGERRLLRLEVGDRLVRLPGPSFDIDARIHDEDYWSHEPRAAVSFGLRF